MTAPDFTARPLVYVAGPYTNPDPVANTGEAIMAGGFLADCCDVTPVVPHLSMAWHLVDPRPVDWWYAYDLALLARCDALYRMFGDSTGADAEVDYAEAHGIPVLTSTQQVKDFGAAWKLRSDS